MKLSPEFFKSLVKLVNANVPISHAVEGLGYSRATYYNWKNEAEEAELISPERRTSRQAILVSGFMSLRIARAKKLKNLLSHLIRFGKGYKFTETVTSYDETGKIESRVEKIKNVAYPQALMFYLRHVYSDVFGASLRISNDELDSEIAGLLGELAGERQGSILTSSEKGAGEDQSSAVPGAESASKSSDWKSL